jgi:hypothetical protein
MMRKAWMVFLTLAAMFFISVGFVATLEDVRDSFAQETDEIVAEPGVKVRAKWIRPETNTDGTPLVPISHFDLALAELSRNLNSGASPNIQEQVTCLDEECSHLLDAMRNALQPGSYVTWCRAVPDDGIPGDWVAAPQIYTVPKKKAGLVRQLRIEIDATITITEEVTE